MTMSRHAGKRAQQRSIPPVIADWLDLYGETEYDGRGGEFRYFSRKSIRAIERIAGSGPVRHLAGYFKTFKVVSSKDGQTITIGHRTKRIRRR